MINRPENVFSYMFVILLALQAGILLFWASSYPVASAYEGEIMGVAKQMLTSSNWFLPALSDGQLVYHTPILPYWLAAAGKLAIPWNDFLGFRLFSILLYLLASWCFFRSVSTYLDVRTAYYSACILACCLPFLWQMQLATPDGLAAILVGASLFGFYLLLKTNKKKFFWLLYGGLAAGVLVKGFPALLLPILIMVVYLMFKIKMNGSTLRKLYPGKGILLVLLVCLPWYLFTGIVEGGNWLQIFLKDYHWERYFTENPKAEGDFYLPFLLAVLMSLPFGLFLYSSFSFSWKYRHKKDLLLLSGLSFFLILLFYAFSGTFYPHYILPALPFAAILIAYRFNSVAGRPFLKMKINVGAALLVVLCFLLPGLVYYFVNHDVQEFSNGMVMFSSMLMILPLGTAGTLFLWVKKRTDEGMSLLVFSYLIFFVLLLHFANLHESVANNLQYILY